MQLTKRVGVKPLLGFVVRSTGVTIGRVSGMLLDPQSWRLRYLEIKLVACDGEQLLPMAVAACPDTQQRYLPVGLTRAEIEDGPATDPGRPLTRPQELALHEHYRWTPYWSAGAASHPPSMIPVAELMTFRVDATDGALGRLDDLVVEDDWWTVVDLVVAGRHGRVEVSPKLVGRVDPAAKRVTLNVALSQVPAAERAERLEARA